MLFRSKVLTEKPQSIRMSRPNVPERVDAAVMRALEKLAADRFGTAHEFAEALQGKGAPAVSATAAIRGSARGRFAPRELVAWAGVVVLAAVFAWSRMSVRTQAEWPVVRTLVDLPAGTHIDPSITGSTIAVSPDGGVIAYNA